MFQELAIAGEIAIVESICTKPLNSWLTAHISALSLENAGSSELIFLCSLYLNTCSERESLAVVVQLNVKLHKTRMLAM
jgi:hypothetical protein|tara:strand:- start:279 stop:515 length:237 start_codon:yes stop_codon:yes gene_type:complete